LDQSLGKYRIDHAKHVAERFEEETVLVNIETGCYFSLSSSGAEILELLNDGVPADNLAHVLFGASENCERFRSSIARFVARLAAEGIIVEREPESVMSTFAAARRYPTDADYQSPVLERFDDVRDLLLIDPIHQVDPGYGWPRKTNAESQLGPRV